MAVTPGSVDRAFAPELRTPIIPEWSALAGDGRVWIGGGFDRADGATVSDLLVLGEHGGIEGEPAPGYLGFRGISTFGGVVGLPSTFGLDGAAFPLADGSFLLPVESGNWLRMSAASLPLGTAFPDLATTERILPQFERAGKLWVMRRLTDGRQTLERRNSEDGTVDPGFSPAARPDDILAAVPAANGGAWVLAGDPDAAFQFFDSEEEWPEQFVFQVQESGAVAGEPRGLPGYRSAGLIAAGGDEFRVQLGPSRLSWNLWPRPESSTYTIEWCATDGGVERTQDFGLGLGRSFSWAEGEDGSYLTTTGDAVLSRYSAAGVKDPTFTSPGRVRSVIALPAGKWLVDGTRRLNADGTPDETWTVPLLDAPAAVSHLHSLSGGKVLAAGSFTTADGAVRKGLAMFLADGSLDPSFVADARVGEVTGIESSGEFIYLVTREAVALRQDLHTNFLKMRMNGSLDESFALSWQVGASVSISSNLVTLNDVNSVTALKGGDLVVTAYGGYEVASTRVTRIKPDGTLGASFSQITNFQSPRRVVATADGGFVRGSAFHKADGTVIRDLGREGVSLEPLCEWQGGMLFQEKNDSSANRIRLRLWKGKNWAAGFSAPSIDASYGFSAVPGENGVLYVYSAMGGSRPAIRRFLSTGKLDPTFRSPVAGVQIRREPGDWWLAGNTGKLPFDPARNESEADIATLLWNGNRLWLGGNFNVIDGQPRDGLARVFGGKAARNAR